MSDLEKDKECCGGTKHNDPNHECCGGDCGHDHDEVDVIVLKADDGEEITCQPLETFEYNGKEYLVLLELQEQELIFTEYEEVEDEFFLNPIVDDQEYENVGNYYLSLLENDAEDQE